MSKSIRHLGFFFGKNLINEKKLQGNIVVHGQIETNFWPIFGIFGTSVTFSFSY